MQEPRLGVAHRQVAVGVARHRVEDAVTRAVHRLERERPLLVGGHEHVVAVLVPVPGDPPQLRVVELRRLDLGVPAGAGQFAGEVAQRVPQRRAVGHPERASRRQLGELEQAQLAPEPAVVARARQLEALEVLLERRLREERRAVDAGEHRPLRVAAPVRAGHRLQGKRLDGGGARGVRAAAQVGERPVGVQRHRLHVLVAHEVIDQLDLVRLLLGDEPRARQIDGQLLADERLGRPHVLEHLGLDRGKVLLGDRDPGREVEVVVEAVVDRRADAHLDPGVELGHRGGQDVGGVVADQREGALAVGRQDRDRGTVVDRLREVAQLAVDLDRERRARQPRPDRRRRIGAA